LYYCGNGQLKWPLLLLSIIDNDEMTIIIQWYYYYYWDSEWRLLMILLKYYYWNDNGVWKWLLLLKRNVWNTYCVLKVMTRPMIMKIIGNERIILLLILIETWRQWKKPMCGYFSNVWTDILEQYYVNDNVWWTRLMTNWTIIISLTDLEDSIINDQCVYYYVLLMTIRPYYYWRRLKTIVIDLLTIMTSNEPMTMTCVLKWLILCDNYYYNDPEMTNDY